MTTDIRNTLAIVDEDSSTCGALALWNCATTTRKEFRDNWIAQGLSEDWLKSDPGKDAILGRAVKELKGKHLFARKVGAAWLLVREQVGDQSAAYDVVATITLGDSGPVVELQGAPSSTELQLVASFQRVAGEMTAADVGQFLSWVLRVKLSGVSLKDNGGVYYVPPMHKDTLAKIRAACAPLGCRVSNFPAAKTASVIADVLAAMEAEASAALAEVEASVQEARDKAASEDKGHVHKATIRATSQHLDTLRAKLSTYGATFGQKFGALNDRIYAVRTALTSAVNVTVAVETGRDVSAPRLVDMDDAPKSIAAWVDPTPDERDARFSALEIE